MTETTVDLGGRRVRLTSPERPMWPAAGLTKGWLVDYYLAVADAILPHLAGRPLTLARFPEGTHRRGFLQNECRGAPPWMRTAVLPLRNERERRYCVIDDAASLAWVANLAAVELHPYLLDAAGPEHPVALVVDLDPGPGAGLAECCRLALRVRELLGEHGLHPRVKTSGRIGLHLLAPVTDTTFAQTRALARGLAERVVAESPDAAVATQKRSERAGRVLVDWQQNDPRRSTVAPYSLRAGAAAPRVSTPLTWDEVEAGTRDPEAAARLRFGPVDVLRRLERYGDLFAPAGPD